MRCVFKTVKGKQCRWPSSGLVGGVACCDFHAPRAARDWEALLANPRVPRAVIEAAARDTAQINSLKRR
jgi:hypothetical protein